uniref:TSA: Wollemia nobilis Ref_Wollemi_Transcript_15749_1113 transcribed RNA sequence n=1 Tax=Wollemia nobilis TaxID=56998 RepID=A0A0C9QNR5_9CONI
MKGNFNFGAIAKTIRDRNCRSAVQRQLRGIATNVPPPNPKRLEGKTALITGAATGIGEATARVFAAHGARVVVADVQAEAGARLAAELGNGAAFVRCDVRNEDEVAAAVDKAVAVAATGALDVFYYNAGILGATGPIDALRMDEFDLTMGINLRGAVLGVKHAARVMKPAGKGSILCTGSVCSVIGGMGPHPYTISKAAMGGLVRSAALELRRFGIRVNMVSPDSVATPIMAHALEMLNLTDGFSMEAAERYVADVSQMGGRCLTSNDVAHAALFLASDECTYISGHNLVVDSANTVANPNENARWYTEHFPLFTPGTE